MDSFLLADDPLGNSFRAGKDFVGAVLRRVPGRGRQYGIVSVPAQDQALKPTHRSGFLDGGREQIPARHLGQTRFTAVQFRLQFLPR